MKNVKSVTSSRENSESINKVSTITLVESTIENIAPPEVYGAIQNEYQIK